MCNSGATNQYLSGMAQGIADQRGTTVTSNFVPTSTGKLSDFMFRGGRARGPDLNAQIKATPKNEDTPPPVLRSSSSSASARNLGIKNRGNVNKRNVTSGRRTSKAKRFSTRSK
jgi:hypothetical protein|tara:strand:- start:681 stop:1022 length:342 start_codon:yes stop_codon:yes gene_type:complete